MIRSFPDILRIIDEAREEGWVLEPQAKRLFSLAGLVVPRFVFARTVDEATGFSREIGYPVVAKIVSPKIVHKSDVGGVVVGIRDDGELASVFERLRKLDGFLGVLVEELLPKGIELILGAKVDLQFGPMILLGMGGTGVEIYKDVVLRMAPLAEKDASALIGGLKARRLLEGYRGARPVDKAKLTETILAFSEVVMALKDRIESIDINPLLCYPDRCVVADARIIVGG